jgi:hypothetical protein
VQLNLSDERWDGAVRYATTAYPGQPLAFGIRELLLVGAGLDPLDAAIVASRISAYNEMTNALRHRVLAALGPLVEAMNTEVAKTAAVDRERVA